MATPATTDSVQPITWAIDQLKFLIYSLIADDKAVRIVDRAMQDLDSHRQTLVWNAYAAEVNARPSRQRTPRAQKGQTDA